MERDKGERKDVDKERGKYVRVRDWTRLLFQRVSSSEALSSVFNRR